MATPNVEFISLAVVVLIALFSIFRFVNLKISHVYTNFDKFKEEVKKDYVRKDMCKTIDGHRHDDISKLEAKLDEIIRLLMQERQSGNDTG